MSQVPIRVLAVHEEEGITGWVKDMLMTRGGYEVIAANEEAKALKLIAEFMPEIGIIDLYETGEKAYIDGIRVHKRLKEVNPEAESMLLMFARPEFASLVQIMDERPSCEIHNFEQRKAFMPFVTKMTYIILEKRKLSYSLPDKIEERLENINRIRLSMDALNYTLGLLHTMKVLKEFERTLGARTWIEFLGQEDGAEEE